MSKFNLLAVAVCMLLCVHKLYAQNQYIRILSLDEIFWLAEQNNKQLNLARTGLKVAQNATDMVKNVRLPSIDASLSFSYLGNGTIMDRKFTNIKTAEIPHFGNNFSIEASQVIFTGGAISNSIVKAELEEQVAQLLLDKNRIDIRFLLTGYYLDLYKLSNQRIVYLKNIEQTNILIKQIKAKQREGMALNNDITRYELILHNLEFALIEIDNNLDILNYHLTTALGLDTNTIIKADTSLLNLNLSSVITSDLIQIAETNLPELKSAKVKIDIADKEIKITKANYLPIIALVAANHFNGPITIEVPAINKNFNYWYAGVGIKYNLSSLFKSNKNVRLAKCQKLMATEMKDIIEEQSTIAIHTASTKYKEAFEKLHTLEKSFQLSNENYRIVNNRYLNDLVLITEMLDASNTKLNAELQVVNAKINIIYNYYKLQYTTGKL